MQTLLDEVRRKIPKDTPCDGLYFSEEQTNIVDPKAYINEQLRADETVYYGSQPQNDAIIELRKYQKELVDSAVKENRYLLRFQPIIHTDQLIFS